MERIGVSIDPDVIRVAVMRGGKVVWAGESVVRDPVALSGEIAALLASAPRSRWRNRSVIGAIGANAAQLKRIGGLPAAAPDRVLSDAVRLNAPRFFLTHGAPLLTSNVVRRDAELWCAAADESVVAALAEACSTARVRFRGCVPSIAMAGSATALGAEGARFAEAYRAAVEGSRSPFLIDPGAGLRAARRRTRVRALLAAGVVVVLAGILLGPAIGAIIRERAATARLRTLAAQAAAPLAAIREVSSAAAVVRRVDAFASSRRSAVALLGSLSQVLPESTAIVSFHMDSTGGTLVALTPIGNTIIPDLSRAVGVVSAEITGAVTREAIAGVPVQRLVTTFRFVRPSKAKAGGVR
ncbi:MAG TPA: hypothetical protein VGI97_06345 [Gemmatimonadaceae bacterium]|jgi:hypothetical protein